jgi:hypothetical protein
MAKHVIKLLGDPIQNEDDKAADATVVPGMLVTWNGSGNIIRHATAGGNAQKAFALEREEMGKGAGGVGGAAANAAIDTAYATNDTVKVGIFAPGMRVYALVATGAPAIVKGDFLESAGDGTLRKSVVNAAIADTTRNGTVGRALEALTNVSGVNARLRVEIM